jgi:hypothetical protein
LGGYLGGSKFPKTFKQLKINNNIVCDGAAGED